MTATAVHGFTTSGFEELAEAVRVGCHEHGESGCALALTIDGQTVCDVWCGEAAPGQPWQRDTLAVVFSATKGMTALCAQMLACAGELDTRLPVAKYWPEFAQEGKAGVTVRQLLNHTAGVLTFPRYWEDIDGEARGLDDWDLITKRLAAAPPAVQPGRMFAYHAITYGFLLGEVIRRITGMSLGRFFGQEVASKIGLDAYIGLPPELHTRTATIIPAGPTADPATRKAEEVALRNAMKALQKGDAYAPAALLVASPLFMRPDDPDPVHRYIPRLFGYPWIQEAELPGSNGISDARSLARMYVPLATDGTVDGIALVAPTSIERWSTPEPLSIDPEPVALGYAVLNPGLRPSGLPHHAFGHPGFGGALAFADPALRMTFAYVKSRMSDAAVTGTLVKTAYRCATRNAVAR